MKYADDYYFNSLCLEGKYLHDYEIRKTFNDCVLEVCTRCKDRKQFKLNGSNRYYLSYHIKQTLQPKDKRFYTEYPHLINN